MNIENNCNCCADEEIQNLLEEIAQEEGLREYKIRNADGSVNSGGYNGIITSVQITGKTVENDNKALHLVVKSASKSDAFRKEMHVVSSFESEIHVYDTVFPTFKALEMEKGLEPSFFAPKLYKVSLTQKSEAILMENLKENGYKLHDGKIPMNDNHVSLVMSQYGRFHAISFTLRDQYPEKFAKLVEPLTDLFMVFLRETFFNTLMHRCTKALEALHKESDQKARKRWKNFIDNIEAFCGEIKASVDDYSAILHADCWINNMMFKYEDNNAPEKPTQVRFLDFQLSKVGPPVLDLAYFFYVCSSKEIIDNLSHYMQLYYNSFSVHLQKLGSDPDKVYPYSVLQQQWKKFGKFGLLLGTTVIHGMLSEKDELVDLRDLSESETGVAEAFSYEIANVKEYNERIRHIILHLVENDFI